MIIRQFRRLALCGVLMSSATMAQNATMELAINDGLGEDLVIRIDSSEQGIDLHKMQLGESHALNTVDGRPVVVTRVEDGHQFDVDGRQISIPLMDYGKPGEHHEELRIVRHMEGGPGVAPEGVTIISANQLDDATRASITATLAAAGERKVRFIDIDTMASGPHARHLPGSAGDGAEVRIVRKEVRVTN